MLERAGIKRPPDLLVAATGDDEDNIVICQLAREKYGVEKVIARINDPRNQPYFDLLGISPTVSATGVDHGADRARGAGARPDPPARAAQGEPRDRRGLDRQGRELQGQAGRARSQLPEGARLISVVRDGKAEIPDDETQIEAGDQVLAILEPGKEDELRRILLHP